MFEDITTFEIIAIVIFLITVSVLGYLNWKNGGPIEIKGWKVDNENPGKFDKQGTVKYTKGDNT